MVKKFVADWSLFIVYGHVVGFSPLRMEIRDWLQANLCLEDNHIIDVALMGRGIVMLKLSIVECTSNLVAHSPIVVDGNILSFILWYRGFRALDFDT